VFAVCLAVIKMRRSNSWSEAYEDFAVTEENTELADSGKDTDKDRQDNLWSVGSIHFAFTYVWPHRMDNNSNITVVSH